MSSVAIWMILVPLILLVLGVPIGWSLASGCLTAILFEPNLMLATLTQRIFSTANSFTMIAIPAFMVAGEIMNRGGISRRIVKFCQSLLGQVSGSLSMVSIIACTFFAALTGSGMATAAAIGGIMLPEMKKHEYPGAFSAAVISIGATLGPIIPPSILFILYANATGLSVTKLMLTGLIPGLLAAGGMCVLAFLISKKKKIPKSDKPFRWSELWVAFKEAFFALLMPFLILGSIYSGICTATESAGIAVAYGLFVSIFIYKEIRLRDLLPLFISVAKNVANLLILCWCAQAFGWYMAYFNIPSIITNAVMSVASSKVVFILLANLLFIVAGMFMDTTAVTLIMAPIMAPIAAKLGINPIHFGFIMVYVLCIGNATPPFGPTTFIACNLSGEPIIKVSKELIPFILWEIGLGLLCSFVPQIPLFLTS